MKTKKIKAVLIDFDGVILDSWPIALEKLKKFSKEMGRPLTETDEIRIRKNWGHPGKKILEILFPDENDGFRQEFYKKWVSEEKEVFKENLPLIKGIEGSLNFLNAKGIITGLITNRGVFLFLPISEKENILKKFTFIQTFGKTDPALHKNHLISDFPKPDPRAFDKPLKFLKEKGISPKETVFFEDSLISIKSTKKRKIRFMGVCTGPIDTPEKWKKWGKVKPKDVLNSIADLPAWFKKQDKRGG